MKKIVLISMILLTLSGCGKFDRWAASMLGNASSECVHGVEYLQFTSGASVAYDTDGHVRKCSGGW